MGDAKCCVDTSQAGNAPKHASGSEVRDVNHEVRGV
jgi:hypothetical protein